VIILSKLDNSPILLSLETIKYIEQTPDTLVFFVNGDSVFVKEPLDEIHRRVIEYKATVLKKAEEN